MGCGNNAQDGPSLGSSSSDFGSVINATNSNLSLGGKNEGGKLPWVSLFGVKPNGKSSFPPVTVSSNTSNASVSITIPDPIVDHNISIMALSLVGKFMGPRPNIETIKEFVRKKWGLKGQVEVVALPKGFFSFSFSCEEDIVAIRCGRPWVIDKSLLALKKWTPNGTDFGSFYEVVPIWVRLPRLPMEF